MADILSAMIGIFCTFSLGFLAEAEKMKHVSQTNTDLDY